MKEALTKSCLIVEEEAKEREEIRRQIARERAKARGQNPDELSYSTEILKLNNFILEKQSCRLIAGNSRSTKYPVQIRPLDMARRLASPYQYRQLQVFRVASP